VTQKYALGVKPLIRRREPWNAVGRIRAGRDERTRKYQFTFNLEIARNASQGFIAWKRLFGPSLSVEATGSPARPEFLAGRPYVGAQLIELGLGFPQSLFDHVADTHDPH
jgi:hypothetical protein